MKNLMSFVLFLLVIVASAQGRTAEERATALTAKMQSEIKFNDETKAKVYAINLDFVNKSAELRNADGERKERFIAFKKLDDERAGSLKKIFTETEYAAFEKFREQNRQQMKQRLQESRN